MSLFCKIAIFVILIFGIIIFNRVTFTPLVEGHGGRGGIRGGGRGIGYAGIYYGGYGGGDNDYGFYDYYPPVYGEYSYDVYGNPIIIRPGYYI